MYEPCKRPEFNPNLLVGEGLPPDLLRGWGPLSNSLEGITMDVHLHCSGSNSFWSYLVTYWLLLHSYQQVAALKKGGSTVELKVIHSSAGSLGTEALWSWKPRVARDAGFCMKLAVRGPNCALYWYQTFYSPPFHHKCLSHLHKSLNYNPAMVAVWVSKPKNQGSEKELVAGKIHRLIHINLLPTFLWKLFPPPPRPKFSNVCVLFKHSNFLLQNAGNAL